MGKKTAEVEIKVTGGEDAAAKVKGISDQVGELGQKLKDTTKPAKAAGDAFTDSAQKAGASWKSFGQTMGSVAGNFVKEATRLSSVSSGITMASATDSAKKFQIQLAQLSAYTGKSTSFIKASLDEIGKAKGLTRDETSGLYGGLAQMSHDADYAGRSMGALADEALLVNKSAGDMAPLGAQLHNIYGVSGDVGTAFAEIRATAEQFGTVGGAETLQDQMLALAGSMETVAVQSDESRKRFVAMLGAMQGKSADPMRGARMMSQATGAVQGQAAMVAQFLGKSTRSLFDQSGHMDITKLLPDIQAMAKKKWGKGDKAWEKAFVTFGPEIAQMIYSQDLAPKEPPKAGLAKAKGKSKATGEQFAADTAKRRKEIEAENNASDAAKPLAEKTWFDDFAAEHPFAANLGKQAFDKGTDYLSVKLGGKLAKGAYRLARGGRAVGQAVSSTAEGVAEGAGLAGSGGVAGILGLLATIPMTAMGLRSMARGTKAQMGFKPRELTGADANAAETAANAANAKAGSKLSPGMQAAMAAEQKRLKGRRSEGGGGGGGVDPLQVLLAQFLQQVANNPVKITVVNQTGGPVEAMTDRQRAPQ